MRRLKEGRRGAFKFRCDGASCCTVPGVVFCKAKGGGEFIRGTSGTSIFGGGGGAGGGGSGITGEVPGC